MRKQKYNFISSVACLSYIQAMVRLDITISVQQCAIFVNDPSQYHKEVVKCICRYLLNTKAQGIALSPDKIKLLECYTETDWAKSWQQRSSDDQLLRHLRTVYVIIYASCSIIWASKMQYLISLSTTEAEFTALSTALWEVIGIFNQPE